MMSSSGSDPNATSQASTILIVDDTPQNLSLLGELLQPHYRVLAANSGTRALRALENQPPPDLILLDVMMPDLDGYEVMQRIRDEPATRDIPVILVTALGATEDEERGLALGAADYVSKPINPSIVLARVRTQLELKRARDRMARQNDWLEVEVERRARENLLVRDVTIRALACLSEARDHETGHHILRTQAYVEVLARHLANAPRFAEALAGNRLDLVVKAAPLHDIGKVGIPDSILRKPGKLTPDEFAVMKMHPDIGAKAIAKAMRQTLSGTDGSIVEQAGDAFGFLRTAQEIALGHHEKWNGSGYPAGLAGENIPHSARLMALADVFDALMAQRVYKPAISLDETTRIIAEARGTHFDPDVVDAFLACHTKFAAISDRLADP